MKYKIYFDSILPASMTSIKGLVVTDRDISTYFIADRLLDWFRTQTDIRLAELEWNSKTDRNQITKFYMIFNDPVLATLFKLTWGGK